MTIDPAANEEVQASVERHSRPIRRVVILALLLSVISVAFSGSTLIAVTRSGTPMSTDRVSILMTIVATLGIIGYFAAILYAAWFTYKNIDKQPQQEIHPFITGLITVIGGTLATYFGAICGLGAQSQITGREAVNDLQFAAALSYLFSLVLALLIWAGFQFSVKTPDGIRNLALTLPGVLAGALAVTLNIQLPHAPGGTGTPAANATSGTGNANGGKGPSNAPAPPAAPAGTPGEAKSAETSGNQAASSKAPKNSQESKDSGEPLKK